MRPYFVTVNGTDLKTKGFTVREATGLWESVQLTLQEQAVYRKAGAVLLDDEPIAVVRDLAIAGTYRGTDADNAETKLLGMKRLLGPLGRRNHVLVFGNLTAQQITARYMGMSDGPTGPQMEQRTIPMTLHFRSLDPYFVDVTATTLSAAEGVPVDVPMGTGLSEGVSTITFAGSAASTTRTYKSNTGATLGTTTLTHAFVNADVVVINDAERTISLNGVRNEGLLSNGDFIRMSPDDGDPSTSDWATLEVNHGALSHVYRRTWE